MFAFPTCAPSVRLGAAKRNQHHTLEQFHYFRSVGTPAEMSGGAIFSERIAWRGPSSSLSISHTRGGMFGQDLSKDPKAILVRQIDGEND